LFIDFSQSEQPFDLIYTLDNDQRPGVGSTNQRFIPISQGFIQSRDYKNAIVEGTAFSLDNNLFENTSVVLSNLDSDVNYALTLRVQEGQGTLRWATNISPLEYSDRSESITITGTLDFINDRLQSNRIQHRSNIDLVDNLNITVTLIDSPAATRNFIQSALLEFTPTEQVRPLPQFNYSDVVFADNLVYYDTNETNNQPLSVVKSINIFDANEYKFVLTPNNANAVDTISTTSNQGTFNFDTSTKIATLDGNVQQLLDQLINLQIKVTSTETDYNILFDLRSSNNQTSIDSRTLSVKNIEYPTFSNFNFRAFITETCSVTCG
jgi:hypothetical protein